MPPSPVSQECTTWVQTVHKVARYRDDTDTNDPREDGVQQPHHRPFAIVSTPLHVSSKNPKTDDLCHVRVRVSSQAIGR